MDSLAVSLESAFHAFNRTVNGPFHWAPDATRFYDDNATVLMASVILYLPVIFGLKAIMKNREPFDLRWLLVPWNAALTIFSATGFYYTWPVLMENLFSKPLTSVLCDPACYSNHVARWVFFFNVSKFFEFGDTLFIVLRKKPLIFLHYYHHVMTCLYCWYANQVSCSTNCTGWPFATMNLFVHTLMYFHYALAGMGIHANWSVLLTSLQLLQMVVGIGIVSYSALYCPNAQDFTFGTYFALIMYFSYAVLFANFFIQRYCGPKRTSRKPKTE